MNGNSARICGVKWRSTKLLKKQAKDAKEAAERAKSPENKKAGENFCHECGQSAQPNDKFYAGCGTPLRMAATSTERTGVEAVAEAKRQSAIVAERMFTNLPGTELPKSLEKLT